MSEKGTLFDDEFLKKLEYLNIVSSHMIPGNLHGEHRAKKKTDSGIEFTDYRQYVAGEDIKNVDWRTFLRLDKLILRLFEEDADLPIYIFFDAESASSRDVRDDGTRTRMLLSVDAVHAAIVRGRRSSPAA